MTDTEPTRRVRILQALAEAPKGLSTPQLVIMLEGVQPEVGILTRFGQVLRSAEEQGQVRRVGEVPSGTLRGRAVVWVITDEGRKWPAVVAARAAEAAQVKAEREEQARKDIRQQAACKAALEEAAQGHATSPLELEDRRRVEAQLRLMGCTLESIGEAFGLTRECVRLDLLTDSRRQKLRHRSNAAEADRRKAS